VVVSLGTPIANGMAQQTMQVSTPVTGEATETIQIITADASGNLVAGIECVYQIALHFLQRSQIATSMDEYHGKWWWDGKHGTPYYNRFLVSDLFISCKRK